MNNKILFGILAALLAVWGIMKFTSGGEGTFDPEIIAVDSASVDKIIIKAKADEFVIATLKKKDGAWLMERGGKTYLASGDAINNLLTNLKSVKTKQVAAKSEEKWGQYEVGDGQASEVTVFAGGKKVADFYVGKFSVNQQMKQITSYFRLADRPEVYAVEGMAGMMFGQATNSFRDKSVMKMQDPAINEVNLEGDVVYHIKKSADGQWQNADGSPADSVQVQNYLINLRTMSGDVFVDDFDPAANEDKLLKTLTLKGDNLPGPVVVRAWRDTTREKPFIVHSNLFADSYFASDSTRIFTRLFKPIWEW